MQSGNTGGGVLAAQAFHAPWKALASFTVKRPRTVDQDRGRRVDQPLGCDVEAPRLEARSAA